MSTNAQPAPLSHSRPAAEGSKLDSILESGFVPDWAIRIGIRRLLAQRLRDESAGGVEAQGERLQGWIEELRRSPIAIHTAAANEQHYEVPAEFYALCLGKHRKYSSGYWPAGVTTLDGAENAMLERTCAGARLADGQEVLELGCGWGSLSLFMAAKYPASRITAVSNSRSQKRYINEQAAARGIRNLEIRTADINEFEALAQYDRIVSVEMFEHMRNYDALLRKIAEWAKPDALLFVHIFTHSRFAYPFDVKDDSDWMSKHFFTGGQMPSADLLLHFQNDFRIVERWNYNGTHYGKTAEAWLANLDRNPGEALRLFARVYGADEASKWLTRWRIFYMACAELWNFARGEEWIVSHYLFRKS